LELVHDLLCKSILAGLRFAAPMDYSSLGTKEDSILHCNKEHGHNHGCIQLLPGLILIAVFLIHQQQL
jgi:hypothetical protein